MKRSLLLHGAIISICIMFSSAFSAAEDKINKDTVRITKIDLKVSVLASEGQTTLVFTLKNNTGDVFIATPPATNDSKIIIEKPDGKIIDISVSKEFAIDKLPKIKSNESKTWKYNVWKIFGTEKNVLFRDIDVLGEYKLQWVVNGVKSNVVLILKEQ